MVQHRTVAGPTCHTTGIRGFGREDAAVVVVGIAPGKNEVKEGKPFVGQSGKLADAVLEMVGYPRTELYVTNLLCWYNDKPTPEELAGCSARLHLEIMQRKPKLIVALGALATEHFTKTSFGKARGLVLWSDEYDCWVLGTYHPAAVLRVPAFISDLVRDFKKIPLALTWPRNHGEVKYEVVHTVADAQGVLDGLSAVGSEQFVSLDVETGMNDISNLRCGAISTGDMTWVFPREVINNPSLRWPDLIWTYHNGMFDVAVMKAHGVDLPIRQDTLLMSYALDERGGATDEGLDFAVGIHGLKRLSGEFCGAGFYNIDTTQVEDGPVLWEYNAKDAAYTARLAKKFYQDMIDDNVLGAYVNLLIPSANAQIGPKQRGIYIDRKAHRELAIDMSLQWIQTEQLLREEARKYGWPGDINPNSPIQLKKFFNQYLHINVPNTRAVTLEPYQGHPWIAAYADWKQLDKILSSYVVGIEDDIEDGSRIHPDCLIHGARTGRYAYHNPPVQTIPRPSTDNKYGRSIRRLFAAPQGRKFGQADYEQAELWTAAFYSDDDVMLADLLSGDFHSAAAEQMFNTKRELWSPMEWDNIRFKSKFVTFGISFGRGAKSLHERELSEYTVKECAEFIERWHSRYYKHWEWCKAQIREIFLNGEQQAVTGRKRRYFAPDLLGNHAINQGYNFPVQGTSHDHLVMAFNELELRRLLEPYNSFVLIDVHDAILFEFDPQYEDQVCSIIKEVMEKPRWFDRGIPVEIKTGLNWGEGVKWRPNRVA